MANLILVARAAEIEALLLRAGLEEGVAGRFATAYGHGREVLNVVGKALTRRSTLRRYRAKHPGSSKALEQIRALR